MRIFYKRGYFIRLLFSFLAVATSTLILSSVVIYKNYENETIKENNIISEQMLSQTVYGTDLIWDWASKHAIELYNNKELFHLIYGNEISPMDESSAQTVMSFAMSASPFIYSIYLYNGSMNKIFSTVGTSYSIDEFFDHNIIDVLNTKSIYSEYRFIPRTIDFKHYDKRYKKDVLSLVVTEPSTDNEPVNGALVINIDLITIQNLINSFNKFKDDYFVILDQNEKVITHSKDGMFMKDFSNKEYVNQLKKSKSSSGYFTEYEDGEKYLFTYVTSDKLKWSFVRLNDYDKLFEKTYGLRNIIIILTMFLFIVIIGFSFWLSVRFYSPIEGLVKLINKGISNPGKAQKMSEFELISKEYNSIIESLNSLKKQQMDNRTSLRSGFLRSLLLGELQNYNDISKKFEELHIKLELNGFMLILLRVDNYWTDFTRKTNQKDEELLKFAISNIAEEIIATKYNCIAFSMTCESVVVILNHQNEGKSALQEILMMQINEIKEAVKEYLKICISGIIGKTCMDLSELPAIYKNILEISDYRLIFGKGSVVTSEMVEKNINSEYVYQDELEREILDNLKLHNYIGVENKINKFLENIRNLSFDDIMMSIGRLSYATIKVINAISCNKSYKYNYRILQKEIGQLDTLEEIEVLLLNTCKAFMEEVDFTTGNVKFSHINRVIEIIHNEYADSNLSADELASRLRLSSNYLREIFKEIKGMPLSNYINEYRCDKAKEMLLGTNMTISEISEKIGLTNQNYFFTLFKKYSGFTPAQFRIKTNKQTNP